MSKKFSQFTAQNTVDDSDFINITGATNRRIQWPDFLDNIYDRIVTPFIYPTVIELQAAPLRADQDNPIYVRVEETEYRLYKITTQAPGVDDIVLSNGNTATVQVEYRDIGFVVGPETSTIGALATYDNETGTLLANGPLPSIVGVNLIEFPDSASDGYLRKKNDNTLELLTGGQLKTNLELDNVDNTSDAQKVASGPIFDALALKAPLLSPALTGTPTAPTASADTNTTQIATTAYVQGELTDRVQSVATIADLRLISGVSVGQIFNINGIGTFEAVSDVFDDDGQLYVETANSVRCKILNARITGDCTVTVPTYYPTIQAALDDLYPRVIFDTSHTVAINIESGHALTAGFRIDNGDYSGFTLTSSDATVFLDPAFVSVSNTDLDPGVPRSAQIGFLAVRSKMPKWDILVDASGVDLIQSYVLNYDSHGYVASYKGVINSSNGVTNGVNCRVAGSSSIDAYRADFNSSNYIGIAITQNSKGNIAEASVASSATGLDISRGSDVYANLINCSGCAEGLYIRRSKCIAQLANFNNCTSVGAWATLGSHLVVSDSTFDGADPSFSRIAVDDGSIISASNCTVGGSPLTPEDTTISVFNHPTQTGMIFNNGYPQGSLPSLNSSSILQQVQGDAVSVATLTYHTIFDLSGSVRLYGGTIYSRDLGVRLTIDGVVVLNDLTRSRGQDSAANDLCVISVPQAISTTSMKLEAYNRSGSTASIGYKIWKQGGV